MNRIDYRMSAQYIIRGAGFDFTAKSAKMSSFERPRLERPKSYPATQTFLEEQA
jgi:hypothetical protein